MTKAIRVHNTGGPEVMTLEDVEVGQPGAGEVRVRHTAIGLNFIDVYFRTGAYPVQTPLRRASRRQALSRRLERE